MQPQQQITPQQALTNLMRIADAALLNKADRRATDLSVNILQQAISPTPKAPGSASPTEPVGAPSTSASDKPEKPADDGETETAE